MATPSQTIRPKNLENYGYFRVIQWSDSELGKCPNWCYPLYYSVVGEKVELRCMPHDYYGMVKYPECLDTRVDVYTPTNLERFRYVVSLKYKKDQEREKERLRQEAIRKFAASLPPTFDYVSFTKDLVKEVHAPALEYIDVGKFAATAIPNIHEALYEISRRVEEDIDGSDDVDEIDGDLADHLSSYDVLAYYPLFGALTRGTSECGNEGLNLKYNKALWKWYLATRREAYDRLRGRYCSLLECTSDQYDILISDSEATTPQELEEFLKTVVDVQKRAKETGLL